MKPVRLSSLEVLQTWGARGEASVSGASACHRARPRTCEMHVPVLAEASSPRAPTSVAWIPPPTRAGRRHRGTHTWMASFSVEHTFDIVNVSRMTFCPRLLLSSILS